MRLMLTQDKIVSMMKDGYGLFHSRGVGSYPGHFYIEKGEDRKTLNSVPVNALIRKNIIVFVGKAGFHWNDPIKYVLSKGGK